jgi:hypothetical protein
MSSLWIVSEEAWWCCVSRRSSDSIYAGLLWGEPLRRVL